MYQFLQRPDAKRFRLHVERAQGWLNRFCRHNFPSEHDIVVKSHLLRITLAPLEFAMYAEKERELRGLDSTAILRMGRHALGGKARERRLRNSLRGCEDLSTAFD